MASIDVGKHLSSQDRHRSEVRQYWLMFCLVYPFCLGFAAIARLLPRNRRDSMPGFGGNHSLFREARMAASSCIPFAFR